MIIHSDAGVGKFEKDGKKTVQAAIAFYTSDGILYHEKIENFNNKYAKSTSNTAELLASLKAFETFKDKLEEVIFYTDCDILPLAKNYYLTHEQDRYVDPLLAIKNVAIENHLEDKLELLIEAIKKVKIVKVKGHTKGMENSYIDDVCYKVLNNQEPLGFDEYVSLTKFSIFSEVSVNELGYATMNPTPMGAKVENDSHIHFINEEAKKATTELLEKIAPNSQVANSNKSIREKRIYHKYINEKNEEKTTPSLSSIS
jgi:ribonuclease HI